MEFTGCYISYWSISRLLVVVYYSLAAVPVQCLWSQKAQNVACFRNWICFCPQMLGWGVGGACTQKCLLEGSYSQFMDHRTHLFT